MSQSGGAGSTVYFLHTIWYWLHVHNSLQHALDRFSAACEKYRGRLLCLSTNPRQCMRQYTAAGGEVQVPRGGIYEPPEGGARRLIHGLVMLTKFCVSFIAL